MSMTLGDPKATGPVATVVADGPVEVVAEVGAALPPRHWSHWKTAALVALPLFLALYVYAAARSVVGAVGYRPPEVAALVPGEPDGAALYVQNCARCHGIGGNGDGAAALEIFLLSSLRIWARR